MYDKYILCTEALRFCLTCVCRLVARQSLQALYREPLRFEHRCFSLFFCLRCDHLLFFFRICCMLPHLPIPRVCVRIYSYYPERWIGRCALCRPPYRHVRGYATSCCRRRGYSRGNRSSSPRAQKRAGAEEVPRVLRPVRTDSSISLPIAFTDFFFVVQGEEKERCCTHIPPLTETDRPRDALPSAFAFLLRSTIFFCVSSFSLQVRVLTPLRCTARTVPSPFPLPTPPHPP